MTPEPNLVHSLETDVDYANIVLPILTVYDHPIDFPDWVVVRVWEGMGARPTNTFKLCRTVAEACAAIPPRFARIERSESDDPKIVATYM